MDLGSTTEPSYGPRDPDRFPLTPEIGLFVRETRLARGMNKAELARRADIKYDQVKVIEGMVNRSVARCTMEAVMKALDIEEFPASPEPQPMALWWMPPRGTVRLSPSSRRLIRRARESTTMTQTEMAVCVGTSSSTYQFLEYDKDDVGCDAMTIARVATVLKVRVEGRLGHALEKLGFWYVGGPPRVDWDLVPFGKQSDCEIAAQLDLPLRMVYRERKRRGIPAYAHTNAGWTRELPWTADRLAETLGEAPRLPDGRVDWYGIPLGSCQDTEIARWIGIDSSTVKRKRSAMGIARYEPVLWDRVPLGKYPDTVIAVWVGTSTAAVVSQRRRRKISAAPPRKRRDRGASYPMKLDPRFLASPELRFPKRPSE